MGTTYQMTSSFFCIKPDKMEAALAAVLQDGKGYYETLDQIKKKIKHYKHLPPASKLSELAKAAWGFEFGLSADEEEIVSVCWVWEKCLETHLFKILAPFVQDGCYIKVTSEDGTKQKWEFSKGNLKVYQAKEVWEETK